MASKQTPRQEMLGWTRFEQQGRYIFGGDHDDAGNPITCQVLWRPLPGF
jgi:hypothetical protein